VFVGQVAFVACSPESLRYYVEGEVPVRVPSLTWSVLRKRLRVSTPRCLASHQRCARSSFLVPRSYSSSQTASCGFQVS
jgi:hypothetical protein